MFRNSTSNNNNHPGLSISQRFFQQIFRQHQSCILIPLYLLAPFLHHTSSFVLPLLQKSVRTQNLWDIFFNLPSQGEARHPLKVSFQPDKLETKQNIYVASLYFSSLI